MKRSQVIKWSLLVAGAAVGIFLRGYHISVVPELTEAQLAREYWPWILLVFGFLLTAWMMKD